MPDAGSNNNKPTPHLLADDEPEPFVIMNGESTVPILLVCDHASRRFPAALGSMGLDPFARRCHLALDIGAGPLTRGLAKELRATAVLCQYSRLVVDCNRQLMDPSAFLEFGDGVVIPGNRNLHAEEKELRANAIYWPYHDAVASQVERLGGTGRKPIFISVHSFTPVLNGQSRPWQIGVLWDQDRATAECLLHDLREAGYDVGDNEPYSGKAPHDFTVDHHAEAKGLPHVGIEIRQDLIDDAAGVAQICSVLRPAIASLPARLEPTEIGKKTPQKSA
ncbi:MAG: N-formylglutamate amidohydrolase [Woeseiaceae bacterium]|nr:N-formylglutamate amidohydrolase [Woeseiaceae bacterium]